MHPTAPRSNQPTTQSIHRPPFKVRTYVPMNTHAAFCTASMRDPGPPPPLSASVIYRCGGVYIYMCVVRERQSVSCTVRFQPPYAAALCVAAPAPPTPNQTKPTNTQPPHPRHTHATQQRTRKDFILATGPAPAPSECAHPIPLIAAAVDRLCGAGRGAVWVGGLLVLMCRPLRGRCRWYVRKRATTTTCVLSGGGRPIDVSQRR